MALQQLIPFVTKDIERYVMLNALYHSLNPIAFSVGPVDIRWYGIAYLVGFILAGVAMYRVARRWNLGLSGYDISNVVIGIAWGVIIGARLFYVVFYGDGHYFAHPLEIFVLNEGGMSFHGGLVGAVVAGALVCHVSHISILTMCDLSAIGAPIGLFFGRCANFVNGELWGKPTDAPWGVVFETGGMVARHPSQLYEALLEGLVIFLVLLALSRKQPARPKGTFIGSFLVLYGVFRFLIEFVRVPDAQLGYLFGLITMGQLLSLPLVVVGCGVLLWTARTRRPQVGHVGQQTRVDA